MAMMVLAPSPILAQELAARACQAELTRPIAVTISPGDQPESLQFACASGALQGVNLNAEAGLSTTLTIQLEQSLFSDSIYHVDLFDIDQQRIDWIAAAPSAGELSNTGTASVELTVTPPPELINTVQAVQVVLQLHNGEKSWTRELNFSVTVGEEQPLFRDQFEIDPVIGQFSQRAPARPSGNLTSVSSASNR
ncbi:MAG: hypothetical protein AAGJ52_08705 [Pseudomonadota bacterium]